MTRVRLIYTRDEYTTLAPGTEGEISLVDSLGTVHVKWDNGSTLGLIPGMDRWQELPATDPDEEPHHPDECPGCGDVHPAGRCLRLRND